MWLALKIKLLYNYPLGFTWLQVKIMKLQKNYFQFSLHITDLKLFSNSVKYNSSGFLISLQKSLPPLYIPQRAIWLLNHHT